MYNHENELARNLVRENAYPMQVSVSRLVVMKILNSFEDSYDLYAVLR